MAQLNESGPSWLEVFRHSDVFDLITIMLGITLVISYLVYKKKAETSHDYFRYKASVLSVTVIYIGWLLVGLPYQS